MHDEEERLHAPVDRMWVLQRSDRRKLQHEATPNHQLWQTKYLAEAEVESWLKGGFCPGIKDTNRQSRFGEIIAVFSWVCANPK